jgi:hypothetical protein
VIDGRSVRIVKSGASRRRGKAVVDRLRGAAGSVSMTTDEILALTRGDE